MQVRMTKGNRADTSRLQQALFWMRRGLFVQYYAYCCCFFVVYAWYPAARRKSMSQRKNDPGAAVSRDRSVPSCWPWHCERGHWPHLVPDLYETGPRLLALFHMWNRSDYLYRSHRSFSRMDALDHLSDVCIVDSLNSQLGTLERPKPIYFVHCVTWFTCVCFPGHTKKRKRGVATRDDEVGRPGVSHEYCQNHRGFPTSQKFLFFLSFTNMTTASRE